MGGGRLSGNENEPCKFEHSLREPRLKRLRCYTLFSGIFADGHLIPQVSEAFITGEVVRWARERSGFSYADIARPLATQIDEVRSWEYGESYPPFGKAQSLARLLRIQFGYLFLSKPPSENSPIPDFRTLTDQTPTNFSPDFLEALDHTLLQQDWYREYSEEDSAIGLNFVGRSTIEAGADAVSRDIRNYLLINAELRRGCRDSSAYLTRLSENAQGASRSVSNPEQCPAGPRLLANRSAEGASAVFAAWNFSLILSVPGGDGRCRVYAVPHSSSSRKSQSEVPHAEVS
jgi:transcriptional regulator with XRE-family HTH domain